MSWERKTWGSTLKTQGLTLQAWAGDSRDARWRWQVRGMVRASAKQAPWEDFGFAEDQAQAEAAAVAAARAYLEAELVALMEAV